MSTKLTPAIRISLLAVLALPSLAIAETGIKTGVAAKIGFDTNVFLQDDAALASGQTVAGTKAEAEAYVLSASANVAAEYKKEGLLAGLTYAPEQNIYDDYASETHTNHKVNANLGGSGEGYSYDAKVSFLYVDGTQEAPIYNRLGGSPAIGGAPVRNRREQDLTQYSFNAKRSIETGFVRFVAAGSRQDFHTRHKTISGYSNYVDRSDVNAGFDFGVNLRKDLNVFLGARGGQQRQKDLLGVKNNYSNDYYRVLAGVDGQVLPGLKLSGTIGPDVRSYGDGVRAGMDRSKQGISADLAATYTVDKENNLTAGFTRAFTVSGGGRGAYVYSKYSAAWKHVFSKELSSTVSGVAEQGDFKDFVSAPRNDWIYQVGATLNYTLPCKAKLELGVLSDWSETRVPNTPARAYHRMMTTVGTSYAF